ncbi:MAG TPA: hypothetical protein VHY30_09865 [Verrucomicrobiae bacterium]|jgi:hypothetical protein|nr:hypothetical protein [Verrucomicrobiae bacterium]
MKSSENTSNPSPGLAGDSTAAPGVSKCGPCASHINAPPSPGGASFFIRADGQYFVAMLFECEDGLVKSGTMVLKMVTRKIKTACLGHTPEKKLGVIFMMEEFFLN